ncbi:hypothetical protein [Streptomyces otsuchiensis]|uniref:hypothetical protein n=1 Tax=Streptomyces otsuchiensis TaxID=2681388 RepID=UPI0010308E00|nr:hypothetical protein [Streptomyces otsuchiensis]
MNETRGWPAVRFTLLGLTVLIGGIAIAHPYRHDIVEWATAFPGGTKMFLPVLATGSVVLVSLATGLGLAYHHREALGLNSVPVRVALWGGALLAWIAASATVISMIGSLPPTNGTDCQPLYCHVAQLDWAWSAPIRLVYFVALIAAPISLVVWAQVRAARNRRGR